MNAWKSAKFWELNINRKSDRILSKWRSRGIFCFLSKHGYVYERIPAFLLSHTLILKIVQTLVSYKNLLRKAYFPGGRKIIANSHKLFGEDKDHWESIFFSISVESMAGSQLLVEYQRIVKAGNLPIHKRIDTMFSLDRTDGKNIITNHDEEGLDLLPNKNKNSQLYPVSVEKSWALFINLLLRYMVQVPTEPVNMVAYSGGSLRDYRA